MALSGFGTLLKIGDGGATEVFTTVAEVTSITGPSLQLGTQDVTSHSSAGTFREFQATLIDPGEVTFTIWYDPNEATHGAATGLIKDMLDRTLRNFKLEMPTTPTVTASFAAFVTTAPLSFPIDGAMEADVTLKISGPVTFA
jgi:hypothetical protein